MYEDDYFSHEDAPRRNSSRIRFAHAGSALRASSRSNPRNLPCPTCQRSNMLTPADKAKGYQCDHCANQAERGDY